MKKIRVKILLLLTLLSAAMWGCKEDKLEPLEKSTTKPGIVTNITATAGPGYAILSYTPPADKDLLYVKAVYQLASGRTMEVKSSYYGNSLKVEGFGDTEEHDVQVYAVNRSEIASDPATIKIRPLENPIWGVFRSMETLTDFGGMKLTATNPSTADIAFEIMVEKNGKYVPSAKNFYTSAAEVDHAIRGFDTLSYNFAVTVRDRWLNYSDTLYTTIKPLYETAIPKSGYRGVTLPTDVGLHASTPLSGLWDGDTNGWPRVLMTSSAVLTPQWFTFDIGKLSTLSRIVIWDYPEYLNGRTYFYGGNLLDFEVWGSDNPPADGSFNNWVKLGTFKSKKPSNLPYGVNNNDDITIGAAGLNYTLDLGTPKVRYLRIRSIKNWQGTTFMAIGELQVYGDPR